MVGTDPKAEYASRLELSQQEVALYGRRDSLISNLRGVTFLAGMVIAVLVISSLGIPAWSLSVPVIAFIGLVTYHQRIIRRLERARRTEAYYTVAIDRVEHRWSGAGASGQRYATSDHMYTGDLDIFGVGSLFQLMSRSRTRLGEDTLAEWLSRPADGETISVRQLAVDELRYRLDLREALALLSGEVHDDIDQKQLLQWAIQTPRPIDLRYRLAAIVLSTAALAALFAWLLSIAKISWLFGVLILQILFAFSFGRQIRQLARSVDQAGSGLAILAQVLRVVEREDFETKRLQRIAASLRTEGLPPSRWIARLHGLIQSLNNSLQNQVFAPIAFLLGLPIHLVHRIEVWRAHVGVHIPEWLEAVGEFEALSSLAGYAYEHPNHPFPRIVSDGPIFSGKSVGHPLIAPDVCVRNDVQLDSKRQLILVSGSNMSGKSTLLRTVGINAVLGLAGAPVYAERLDISMLQVGSAMRINDSLQDGKSLFYAVLSRLKSVVSMTEDGRPLLFLLDEILQGTNSHDRRVGAEGVIRRLVDHGAIGLVTTHDLALTTIVDSLDEHAVNVHFEDQLIDGKMSFDYQLRPGVVKRSNALELMRMMGLDV